GEVPVKSRCGNFDGALLSHFGNDNRRPLARRAWLKPASGMHFPSHVIAFATAVYRVGLAWRIVAKVQNGDILRIHHEQFLKAEILQGAHFLLRPQSVVYREAGLDITRTGKDHVFVETMIMKIGEEAGIQFHFPGRKWQMKRS